MNVKFSKFKKNLKNQMLFSAKILFIRQTNSEKKNYYYNGKTKKGDGCIGGYTK